MTKLSTRIPRPQPTEEENKLNLDRIITDVSALVSIATMPKGTNRLARAVSYASASLSVASIATNVFRYIQKRAHSGQYTLKLTQHDIMFNLAESWLMNTLPAEQKLALYMSSWYYSEEGSNERSIKYKTTYDGSIEHEIKVGDHTVRVATEKPESSGGKANDALSKLTERTIVFTCPSAAARDAVQAELVARAKDISQNAPGLHTVRWGSFYRTTDISSRPVESVFLKEGQMDRIIDHLKTFLSNRDQYKKFGIPFRTGMMMYGTPGSGKTSTATAIANALNMDIYYISLRAMQGDQEFEETINKVPRNSIVILEDIDAVNATKDREQENKSTEFANDVSMPCLLNALDGMQSPEGVIFIMTTNHREKMDAALLRPGRVDLMEELNALDTYQLRSMLSYFTGEDYSDPAIYVPSVTPEDGITSAEISQIIRANINTPENFYSEVVGHVTSKLLTKLES